MHWIFFIGFAVGVILMLYAHYLVQKSDKKDRKSMWNKGIDEGYRLISMALYGLSSEERLRYCEKLIDSYLGGEFDGKL